MADQRDILQLSLAAYTNNIPGFSLYVPASWLQAFGPVLEDNPEDPENPAELSEVSYKDLLDYIGHPGGVTRFLKDLGDGTYENVTEESGEATWVFIQIPWDRVPESINISKMKDDMAEVFTLTNTPYHHRVINAVQFRREFPVVSEDI